MRTKPPATQRRMIGVISVFNLISFLSRPGDQIQPSQCPRLGQKINSLLDVEDFIDR